MRFSEYASVSWNGKKMFASKIESGCVTTACASQASVHSISSVSAPVEATRVAGCRLSGAVISTVSAAKSSATRQVERMRTVV